MKSNRSIVWMSAACLLIATAGTYAADAAAPAGDTMQKGEPKAAEPIKPGTIDKPPQAVAPGTMDAPPKPAAPGTLDRNAINPDVEIQKGQKPVPR
jgi:hypothetical protein